MDRYELRRIDYQPVRRDQVDLQTVYKQFLKTHCPDRNGSVPQRLSGFRQGICGRRLCAMGATAMALPESWRRRRARHLV